VRNLFRIICGAKTIIRRHYDWKKAIERPNRKGWTKMQRKSNSEREIRFRIRSILTLKPWASRVYQVQHQSTINFCPQRSMQDWVE
jgi:hypothetical protein